MGSTLNRWQALHDLGDQLFALNDMEDQIILFGRGLCEIIGAEKVQYIHSDYREGRIWPSGPAISNRLISIEIPHINHGQSSFDITFGENTELSPDIETYINAAVNYLGNILALEEKVLDKQSQSDQLSIIRSALTTESSSEQPDLIYQTLAKEICSVFSLRKVEICIKEPDNDSYATRFLAEDINNTQWKTLVERVEINKDTLPQCFLTGEVIFSSELPLHENYENKNPDNRNENWVAIPVVINEDPVGTIQLWGQRTKRFSKDTVGQFSIFATLISAVYRNASLLNEAAEQSWISNVMRQISDAALRYDQLEDLLNEITRIIPLMIDIEKCAVFLTNREGSEFIYQAQFGFSEEDVPKLAMLPYTTEGLLALQAIESGELFAHVPTHITNSKDQPGDDSSCIIFALNAHDKLHGFLMVNMSGNPFREGNSVSASIDAIHAICHQIALSIENFRLIEEKEVEAYTTTVLLQSAEAIALAASIEEALENICSLLPFFIGVDTTIIYLLDQQQRTYHLSAYQSNSWKTQSKNLPQQFRKGTYKGLDAVLKDTAPSVFKIADIPPEDWLKVNNHLIFERLDDYQSSEPLLMLFPLQIQSENSGFILIRESEDAIENREKKIEILNGIARQISVAVQNVQLKEEIVDRERMRREFQFAQEIQRTFLPQEMLEIPGYQIDTLWRPALQLGGDFFDMLQLADNQFGFVIADVSDKGMPAALYMTVARTLIHAAALKGAGPAETLLQVNNQLIENSAEGLFVTVIYGILDAQSGKFVYANAGHNIPIKLNEKNIQWLEKGGMPLGISNIIELVEHAAKLGQGDEIILYTDGVTECRSSIHGFFGEERLENILRANIQNNTGISNLRVIDEKLLMFQGNDAPSDDVTILTIKRAML